MGNIIVSEGFLNYVKKELKKIFPDIKVELEEIKEALLQNVIKREILEGDDAINAKKIIHKSEKKKVRKLNSNPESTN